MATRSIYQKSCPSCAKQVSIDVDRCVCGYSFSTGIDTSEIPADDQGAQEQLFEEYIHARIQQSLNHLQNQQSALLVDPKNIDKASRLMKAYSEVRELRLELDAHLAKKGEPATAKLAAQPGEAFRTAQTEKAEKVMQAAGINTKGCPKCRAVLPETAVLCFCGFAFSARGGDRTLANATDVAPVDAPDRSRDPSR